MLTPMKAIRAKCLDCCAGSQAEVRLCPMPDCPLWPYRKGHRPTKALAAAGLPPPQTERKSGSLWLGTPCSSTKNSVR